MTQPAPSVSAGTWIRVGQSVDGYVFSLNNDGSLEVGYFQNRLKAIRETVIWTGDHWEFKYQGPNGSYLRGHEESIVKRGPRG